jgi:hypothetical protein
METGDTKKNWRQTLQKAEVNPSAFVWEKVEAQLDKGSAKRLRESVFFYKMLAAACITFALVSVAISFWLTNSASALVAGEASKSSTLVGENTVSTTTQTDSSNKRNKTNSKNVLDNTNALHAIAPNRYAESEINNKSNIHQNTLSFTITQHQRQLLFEKENKISKAQHFLLYAQPQTITTNGAPLLTKGETTPLPIQNVNNEEKQIEKKQAERFWTSVGVAAGTFTNTTLANASAPSGILRSNAGGQTAASESNSPGYTYAVNVAVGSKVSKRWLVQGGMSYISQLSDYTATSVLSDPVPANKPALVAASLNEFKKKTEDQSTISSIVETSPYNVNNNIQLISFPVQAGYLVFERDLALQINSGISTDLFLQNTITPDAENLEKTTQGRGDDSPYRPVNFSGLFSTEFSYKFGENYRVSLSPGLRYPFNSLYKNDFGIKSTPLTFDVALRFRYILK